MTIKELIEQLQDIADLHGDHLNVNILFYGDDNYPVTKVYVCSSKYETEQFVELT